MAGRKASASRVSRRTVILGAVATAASLGVSTPTASLEPPPSRAAEPGHAVPDAALVALGHELDRLVRRCGRLRRRMRQLEDRADEVMAERGIAQHLSNGRRNPAFDAVRAEVGADAAWARWSATVDELESVAAAIAKTPAHDLTDLAVKFRALRWALIDDNTIIDDTARRQVLAFGRAIAALAAPRVE